MANAFSFSGDDSQNYDQWLGPLLFEPASMEVIRLAGQFSASSILEIASGTGRLTRHLRSRFPPETKIIASDFSADMLDLAKQKLNDPSIEYQIADAQDLPFGDESFDLVICQFGLMFLPDKMKGFLEARRVLKPGGHFVFSTWDSAENIPLVDMIINQTIIPFFNGENKERFRTPFSLHDPEQLSSFLTEARFKNNKISQIAFKAGRSTPEQVVNGFLLKHPLGRTVMEKDPDALQPMAIELKQRISEKFGIRQIDAELKAFIGVGEK